MEVNELRIGNLVSQNNFFGYVYSIESAEPRKEERFSNKVVVTLFDNGLTVVTIDEIEPIPLTEEWMEKFGFEYDSEVWFNSIALYKCHDGFNYNVNFYEYDNLHIIKYVHQLQNLYFALTGEELEKKSEYEI